MNAFALLLQKVRYNKIMSETYLQQGLRDGKLVRWMENCMPLKIYIASFHWYKAQSDAYKYAMMVRRALDTWSAVSQGKIRFQLVNELRNSQINLSWKRIDRKALGVCHFNFDAAGRLYSAEIEIGLSDGIIHQKYMDENEVYHTILHEVGHALGLGHSKNKSDIMCTPHQYGVINLSQNDVNSINWLYKFPYGSTLKELNQKYSLIATDIDNLVYQIEKKGAKGQFETVKNSIKIPKKDLLQEQTNIAELKKYNLLLQNIQISHDLNIYMNKIKREEN